MKRSWMVLACLLLSTVSIHHEGVELDEITNSEFSGTADFSVSDPGMIHIHRDDSTDVSMVWHNKADVNLSLDLVAVGSLDKVSTPDLPLQDISMPAGNLGQLTFSLVSEADTPLGQQQLQLEWRFSDNGSVHATTTIEFSVDIPSDLSWGAVQGNYKVAPGTQFSFSLNITNSGEEVDNPLIRMTGDAGWRMQWDLGEEPWNGTPLTIAPGGLEWIQVQVWIPEVIDGSPLAGAAQSWQITATSSLDSAVSIFSFNIIPDVFHNASIDWRDEDLVLDPSGSGKLQFGVRNVGNSDSRLEVEMIPLDESGDPVPGVDAGDIHDISGWIWRTATEYNSSFLEVNESAIIDLSIMAPEASEGSSGVRVSVFSSSAPSRKVSIDVHAEIRLIRNGSIGFDGLECRSIDSGTDCSGELTISNTGNFIDSYRMVANHPDWISVSHPETELEVPRQDSRNIPGVTISVDEGVTAFSQSYVEWQLILDDGTIVDILKTNVSVALESNWVFEEVIAETDASGNMTLSCTVQNLGNGPDGLIVVLTVSHFTEHGLIPPDGADFDMIGSAIKDFQIISIPNGQNLTFRAWAKIPDDEPENGTLWMNISMRSFTDENGEAITASTDGDWLGIPWQDDIVEEDEAWLDIGPLLSKVDELWSVHSYTIMAIIVATIMIHTAVKRRIRLVAEDAEKKRLKEAARPPEPEVFSDVESRFKEEKGPVTEIPQSPEMEPEAFVAAFNLTSGPRKQAREEVPDELVEAATVVLDHRDQQELLSRMDDLASGLMNPPEKSADVELDMPGVENITERTKRSDPRGLVSDVPLPDKNPKPVDDLDLPTSIDEPEDDLDI